jgi:type II secretory pathway predicted ATPase ExeA/septal ring-binding cell division protein DamX
MYNEHFGLERSPFRITPDTKLFYPGGHRGEILEALIYAVTSGEGIVKVVGEVGSGKTMLCRMLEERLADRVDIVYLANPSLSAEETLHAIAMEMKLDVDSTANRLQVMHALQERLLEKHAGNRQVVVFVEEAQSMPIATLEEIRLLSNLETNRDKLLQIVLFGQPELDANLSQPEIRQLNERITHSFYLQAFTPEQMREYVNFRMRAVGYRGPDIFRGGAYRRMAKASEGLTRRINILADKALLAAFAEDTFDVGKRHVSIAINDSQFVRTRRWGLPELSLISGLVLIVAAVSWTFVQRSDALSERLQRFLPGGAAEEIAQPAANAQPASPGTLVATTPESSQSEPQASASAAAGEQMASAAGVADSGVPDAAASATQVQAGGDESDAGMQAPSSQSAQSAQSAMTQPAVADGGSRLVLSDTLSKPLQTESRAVAQEHSPAAVDDIEMASDEAPQSSPTPAMPKAESVAVVSPGSGAANADQVASSIQTPAAVEIPVKKAEGVGPLTEARLAATRDWLESVDNRNFSIQLLLTDFARRANLETFLRERQSAGDVDNYYVFETRIRSNIWYGVLYKEYASFGAAKAALEELPEEFRYHQPFIRNVRDIATLG